MHLTRRIQPLGVTRRATGVVPYASASQDPPKRTFGSGWKRKPISTLQPKQSPIQNNTEEKSNTASAPESTKVKVEVEWKVKPLDVTEEVKQSIKDLRSKGESMSQGTPQTSPSLSWLGVYSEEPEQLIGFVELGVTDINRGNGSLLNYVYKEAKERLDEDAGTGSDIQELAFITEVVVDPEYRRQGMGSKLVEKALMASKLLGHNRVALFPNAGLSEELNRFWDSLGFGPISRSQQELVGSKHIRAQVEKEVAEKLQQAKDAGVAFDEQFQSNLAGFMKSRLQQLMEAYKKELDGFSESIGNGTLTQEQERSEQGQMFMADFAKKVAEGLLFSRKM